MGEAGIEPADISCVPDQKYKMYGGDHTYVLMLTIVDSFPKSE